MANIVNWKNSQVLEHVFAEDKKPLDALHASKALTEFLTHLETMSGSDAEESNRIFNLLVGEVYALSADNLDWEILLHSINLRFGDSESAIESLVSIIRKPSIAFEIKWYVYWQLVRHFFTNRQSYSTEFRYQQLKSAYTSIFNIFYKSLEQDIKAIKGIETSILGQVEKTKIRPSSNKIIIVTNQFLSSKHAPTRLCLDMACSYMGMGFEVCIVNLASLPRLGNTLFFDGRGFNHVEQLSEPQQQISFSENKIVRAPSLTSGSTISYGNTDIPFVQIRSHSDVASIAQCLDEHNPALVISLSDSNLLTDSISKLYQQKFPVVTFPTVADLPIQIHTIPVLRKTKRDFVPSDVNFEKALFSNDHYPHRHVSSNASRADVGLPADKYLISIVGSRLQDEVDEDLLKCLSALVKSDSGIAVAFIGSESFAIEGYFDDSLDNVVFLGHQKDLFTTISNTDLFVNPDRVGGGTGAVMALAAGLPVATLDRHYSDVAWSVGTEFSFDSFSTIKSFIVRCKNESSFAQLQRELSLKKYAEKLDANAVYLKLLNDCGLDIPYAD
ncbi:hypothetical protein DBZ36_04015 [Alginatibacterium sediminis]|uniref:Glycosyltransferase family 1 protein n=1 Tax=Alginatibacterium sediminis TaxID=2164068 RepID=A0A420EG03_9ALTE|nr:glycosyltransferase family 4 protein [Alginatibacterium sediminis]RKF19641.1 hypothetical protein DBZ36_04015 [Alginatibacterium sediminis]